MTEPHADFSDVHVLSKEYLSLPREYVKMMGGASWSDREPGLVLLRPEDIVRYDEIAQFLEGFASQRSLVAFGSIVHWFMRFVTLSTGDGQRTRLLKAFAACGRNWRNAGALAGMLSDGIAPAVQPPPVEVLCTRLRDTAFPIKWFTGMLNGGTIAGEVPALLPYEFESHVFANLARLGDLALGSWLKFGRGPVVGVGEKLAVEPPPRTWGAIVEELLNRPRLAGAVAYVDRMVAALSVPPRRHQPQQLPLGGYVDVVTHGSVDRLLPSQHALDDLEFLRRFTENELLFFRREEPPAQNRQEMVIALDQGVRTWGDVRLVLSAAALALAQRADKKTMPCAFACTSHPGVFDPRTLPAERLGQMLEASDLTRDPGIALERVLERPSETPRDVFLLTHPFSLTEEGVRAAALRLSANDRLFALTINAKGHAELAELRRGLPVRLKAFHVDFVAATTPAAKGPAPKSAWSGPIEPFGWPFRFGGDSPIRWFDFDYAGQHLFTVYANSMIYVWEIATGRLEILPRPMIDGRIVKQWLAVVGVVGGFALLGRHASRLVVFHYDLATRVCFRTAVSEDTDEDCTLLYVRRRHTLIVYRAASGATFGTIDLTKHEWCAATQPHQQRHASFWEITNREPLQRRLPAAGDRSQVESGRQRLYHFDRYDGSLAVSEGSTSNSGGDNVSKWQPFIPKTNGRPAFLGERRIVAVQLAARTLAVMWEEPATPGKRSWLSLFRGPDGDFIREFLLTAPLTDDSVPFMLSPDGGKLAQLRAAGVLEVDSTETAGRLLVSRQGNLGKSRLWVGDDSFAISCGRHGHAWHLVEWNDGLIVHSEVNRAVDLETCGFKDVAFDYFINEHDPVEAIPGVIPNITFGELDRYRKGARRKGVNFVLDRYGQVVAFDAICRLVFQFYAYGDSWTAWLPDGTRLGRGMVHHWPNTPGAPAAMGQALRAAAQRGQP